MSHPDDSTIERFVMGMLDDDADFVAHVSGCDECSRKLQREAEVELAMFEIRARASASRVAEARAARAPAPRARRAWRVLGPALAFAAAATVIAWVGHRRMRPAPSDATAAVRVVTCPDGPRQLECIAEANRSGARLEYPKDSPIAALGREPGLTVHVRPRSSDGFVPEIDARFRQITSDFEACARQAIVWQNAPLRTGEVLLSVTIEPDGRTHDWRPAIVVSQGEPPAYVEQPAPAFDIDMELARCLRRAVEAVPFGRRDRAVRVSLSAMYVWRE